MKMIYASLFSILSVLSLALTAEAQAKIPKVTFDHSNVFDQTCSDALKKPISPESLEELERVIPRLRTRWETDGPKLMKATAAIVGRPWAFSEANFAMFLCDGFHAMSFPPLMDMRTFVSSTANGEPQSDVVFVTIIFHELLHHYIDDCLDGSPNDTTKLLEKYKTESITVKNHLHLFAIEKLVYNKLHMEKYLGETIISEKKLSSGPGFTRAREIVDLETPERFIRELRSGGK
jgi:hypothetical protein